MSATEKDVVVNGVRSRVREVGPAAAREAVVFIHGNPGSGEDWLQLMEPVGQFARAVAIDLPGYGKADRPAVYEHNWEGHARHLDGVLEQLGIERAHLVLHDAGGPIGLTWAAGHPAKAASVTLFNVGIMRGVERRGVVHWLMRAPLIGELFQLSATRLGFRLLINAGNPKPLARAFVDRMYDDMNWGTKRALLSYYRAVSDSDATHAALGERLAPLKLPALVLWGKDDPHLPAANADEQHRYFGETEVHLLDGCGHWPFIDEPERVAALVVPFLRRRLAIAAAV